MATLIEPARKCRGAVVVVRRHFFFVVVGIVGLMAGRASAETIRIMPLGDSITVGTTNATVVNAMTGNGIFSFGYRGPLYTKLTDAGYDFQFVGASPEPWNIKPAPNLPPTQIISGPDLRLVDQDHHRGYGGWQTSDIAGEVVNWLNADDPDIVLLHIGTNNPDLKGSEEPVESETALKDLVQTIVDTKPNVTVIIAQIIPLQSYSSVQQYNDYIKNTLVPYFQQDQTDFVVTTVDQYANFLTPEGAVDANMFASKGLYAPMIHPTTEGYARMAQTWFDGIQAVVPEPGSLSLLGAFGLLCVARACWRIRRPRG
jgi:hypothetical protein